MRRILLTGVVALTMSVGAGCGSAEIFHQDQRGGTITLQGSQDGAMEDAHDIMADHCGAHGYTIISRGKVAVGSKSYTSSNTDYGEVQRSGGGSRTHTDHGSSHSDSRTTREGGAVTRGNVQTDQVTGTVPVYEERVTYTCGK